MTLGPGPIGPRLTLGPGPIGPELTLDLVPLVPHLTVGPGPIGPKFTIGLGPIKYDKESWKLVHIALGESIIVIVSSFSLQLLAIMFLVYNHSHPCSHEDLDNS